MKAALLSILKNVLILSVLVVTSVYIFSVYIRRNEFLLLFYILGSLYLLAGLFETYSYRAITRRKPDVFVYVTDAAVTRSVIKIALFLVVGIVLCISGSIIRNMAYICFLRAALELINLCYKLATGAMSIGIDAKEITVLSGKLERIYAADLKQVHYRHGLLYLVKHNGKTVTIRMDMMRCKEAFDACVKKWAAANQVEVVSEP